ncbi:unnamed protein product [Schistocephalus solidus]|uniref:SWIB domain-containing protein n=1 Tax=Schistocephalus solidus TaxID=70667 RepID=A0A183TIM0_SCHSO|nr:unnamed protein product [Schistocephalus solidus]
MPPLCITTVAGGEGAWMAGTAEEIQGYADSQETNNFFNSIKAIYGFCIKDTRPQLSTDGIKLLREKSLILKGRPEYLRSILNCRSTISDTAINRLP